MHRRVYGIESRGRPNSCDRERRLDRPNPPGDARHGRDCGACRELLAAKARTSGDNGYLDGVALNLHGYYTAVEQVFEAIARDIDGEVPVGTSWHRDLLLQMSAELVGVRPRVITTETRACLEEYRGFRHVVRNVYTFSLNPERLESLVQALRGCYELASRDMDAFVGFLSALGDPGSDPRAEHS